MLRAKNSTGRRIAPPHAPGHAVLGRSRMRPCMLFRRSYPENRHGGLWLLGKIFALRLVKIFGRV
jgi:hypothetical protein